MGAASHSFIDPHSSVTLAIYHNTAAKPTDDTAGKSGE
jgi:hypothetical protein